MYVRYHQNICQLIPKTQHAFLIKLFVFCLNLPYLFNGRMYVVSLDIFYYSHTFIIIPY